MQHCINLQQHGRLTLKVHTHFSGIDCCSISCADPAPEETDFVQRGRGVDLSHSHLVHHSVLREGTGSHKLQHLLSLTGKPGVS